MGGARRATAALGAALALLCAGTAHGAAPQATRVLDRFEVADSFTTHGRTAVAGDRAHVVWTRDIDPDPGRVRFAVQFRTRDLASGTWVGAAQTLSSNGIDPVIAASGDTIVIAYFVRRIEDSRVQPVIASSSNGGGRFTTRAIGGLLPYGRWDVAVDGPNAAALLMDATSTRLLRSGDAGESTWAVHTLSGGPPTGSIAVEGGEFVAGTTRRTAEGPRIEVVRGPVGVQNLPPPEPQTRIDGLGAPGPVRVALESGFAWAVVGNDVTTRFEAPQEERTWQQLRLLRWPAGGTPDWTTLNDRTAPAYGLVHLSADEHGAAVGTAIGPQVAREAPATCAVQGTTILQGRTGEPFRRANGICAGAPAVLASTGRRLAYGFDRFTSAFLGADESSRFQVTRSFAGRTDQQAGYLPMAVHGDMDRGEGLLVAEAQTQPLEVGEDVFASVLEGTHVSVGDRDLRLEDLRLVQAVLHHKRLATRKATVVRALVHSGFSQRLRVPVRVEVTQDTPPEGAPRTRSWSQVVEVRPGRTAIVLPRDAFELGPGTASLEVVLDPGNVIPEADEENQDATRDTPVAESGTLVTAAVAVRLPGFPQLSCDDLRAVHQRADAHVRSAWPAVSEPAGSCLGTVGIEPGPLGPEELGRLLERVEHVGREWLDGRAEAGTEVRIIGVVPSGAFDALGSTPALRAVKGFSPLPACPEECLAGEVRSLLVEADVPGWTIGHELAHGMGWVDDGAPDAVGGGHLATTEAPGYDVPQRRRTDAPDLMRTSAPREAYADEDARWISSVTWEALLDRVRGTGLRPSGVIVFTPPPRPQLRASARTAAVGEADTPSSARSLALRFRLEGASATALRVAEVPGPADATATSEEVDTPMRLELRDGAGGLLVRVPIEEPEPLARRVQEAATLSGTDPGVPPAGRDDEVAVAAPLLDGTRQLVLRRGLQVLWTGAVSASAPAVTVQAPVAGDRVTAGEPLTVRWTATDADGGALQADVRLSSDGGATWRTVGEGITAGSLTLPAPADLRSPHVLARVVVSDGVRTGRADSAPFAIVPRVPGPLHAVWAVKDGETRNLAAVGTNVAARTADGPVRRLTAADADRQRPGLSPDGARLAWVRPDDVPVGQAGPVRPGIMLAGADGQGERMLSDWDGDLVSESTLRWSPDGRSLVYKRRFANPAGEPEARVLANHGVWVVDVATGAERRVAGPLGGQVDPVFTPDGRSVVYAGTRPDGLWSIFRVPVEGGTPQDLTPGLTYVAPRHVDLTADGERVVLTDEDRLVVVSLAAQTRRVVPLPEKTAAARSDALASVAGLDVLADDTVVVALRNLGTPALHPQQTTALARLELDGTVVALPFVPYAPLANPSSPVDATQGSPTAVRFDDRPAAPGPLAAAGGPYEARAGQEVALDASASAGTGLTFRWDTDLDGDFDDLAGPKAAFTPGIPSGTQRIRLLVQDDAGRRDAVDTEVRVTGARPRISEGAARRAPDGTTTISFRVDDHPDALVDGGAQVGNDGFELDGGLPDAAGARTFRGTRRIAGAPTQATLVACNGPGSCTVVPVPVTAEPAPRPPTAAPLAVSVPQDEAAPVALGGTDPDGDRLAFELVDAPAHGEVVIDPEAPPGRPAATYVPEPGFAGPDRFTYRAVTMADRSAPAVVEVTVVGDGAPPRPVPPTASLLDATVAEGEAGAVPVRLSAAATGPVTLRWATGAGTAGADDVPAASGTVVVPAGSTTAELRVPTSEDAADEPDETVAVSLTGAEGATIERGTAVLTIADDDEPAPLVRSEGPVPGAGGGGSSTAPATPPAVVPDQGAVAGARLGRAQVERLLGLPALRSCLSRRTLVLTVRAPGGDRLTGASAKVGGRVFRGRASGSVFKVAIDLRGLRKGRYAVEVRAVAAKAGTLTAQRRLRTCAPRRR